MEMYFLTNPDSQKNKKRKVAACAFKTINQPLPTL